MPRRNPWLLAVPFAYTLATRMRSLRAFGHNAAMAWIPAFALLLADGRPLGFALVEFAVGYLAFIAIYELGYMTNDLWDARRDPGGRHRLDAQPGAAWVAIFVAVRIALAAGIALVNGWWSVPVWSIGMAILVLAFAAHNIVAPRWRLLTFPVLAILRFLLPVGAMLSTAMWPAALIVAILLYTAPRWLAYAESKGFTPPELRQRARFRSQFLLWLSPLVIAGCWWARSAVPAIALVYYLAVTALAEPRGRASGDRPAD